MSVSLLPEADKTALLQRAADGEGGSTRLRQRVVACRELQLARNNKLNAHLLQEELAEHCALGQHDARLLNDAMAKLKLSTRAFFRILKIARTIADLDAAPEIATPHLLEAINYRRF